MVTDAGNFYFATPMDRKEYLRIAVELIPQEFMDLYDLHDKVKNGCVYCEIVRGTVEPRQFRHPAIGTPRQSRHGFYGTQPREPNGKNRRKGSKMKFRTYFNEFERTPR